MVRDIIQEKIRGWRRSGGGGGGEGRGGRGGGRG